MKIFSSLVRPILAAVLMGACGIACAQTFPTKPVRIISPYPPGGGNDIISRSIAQKLTAQLGQPVIVENKPGANGIIGTELLAKSPPDGYSIVLTATTHAINQVLYAKLPYDAVRDFSPITLAGSSPLLLAVHSSSAVRTVRELIRMAQAKPGELTYSTAGNGSTGHLASALFAITAGIRLQHVPYKGTAPAVTALLANEVAMSFEPPTTILPQIRAGKLRALGMSSAQRSATAPDIPTIAESGMPDYVAGVWYGFLAPANTPRDIVQRLNIAIAAVVRDADVRELLSGQGIDPVSCTPEEFARLIASDLEKWAKVVKELGVRVE